LYTIASRHEGFAVAILEAMACGLPIVASDSPGVIDVIPRGPIDGGLIVPAADATALAGALLRVFDDPDLAANLRACARRRVQADFSPRVVGDRLRQLLFPVRG
jgi:starch synthase